VIEVVVTDESAAALPGVSVTVARPDTGFTRTVVTAESGTARVPALSPGVYRVSCALSGFGDVVREGVVIHVGQTARIEASMRVAGVAESVTVTAGVASLVDIHKLDSSTNITPGQIESLPVADRDFQRLAFLTPGVQRERGGFRFIGGGPVLGAAGNASQSTILVDGVDLTDPVLGLARARFSQDAIGELRVIANRFDSEIGGSAAGALSIVTKSGTNELRGGLFGFYRADSLRARGDYETSKTDYARGQFGFTLSGPSARDRTHSFTSFEQVEEHGTVLFRPGGAFASLAADVAVPISQTLGFAGFDHRLSGNQQLKLTAVYERFRQENFRVGGVADVSNGQQLDRDNWNVTLGHTWAPGSRALNALYLQTGGRRYWEPTNSHRVTESFSSGNTLVTGANIVGNLLGDLTESELRDTAHLQWSHGRVTHDLKSGVAMQRLNARTDFNVFETGWLIYADDTRNLPILYIYGTGSGDATIRTEVYSAFVEDEFRPTPALNVSLGLRYDVDTNGNNPDFTHSLQPEPRGTDSNNFQPRFGFSWDVSGDGRYVARGGVGLFTGRYLLLPAFLELQQNGETGRVVRQRLNGVLVGLPALALDPANPSTTGIPLPIDITMIADELDNPETTQATAGFTVRLGDTGLYFDLEGIYAKGRKEIIIRDVNFAGNAAVSAGSPARINRAYNQIDNYTNEGRSEYEALVASLNGTLAGGHMITASLTLASKKNISDDFNPALVDFPSDPFDIGAEWGRSRADERFRAVVSGVFRLPWRSTAALIAEYGSGQPWNRRLGYDRNGDGRNADRIPGMERFSEDGPSFFQLSLRLTHRLEVGSGDGVELIAEAFNLTDRRNDDVNSVQSGEFLSGPTLRNPNAAPVPNPRFGQYTASLPPREIQLGVRYTF